MPSPKTPNKINSPLLMATNTRKWFKRMKHVSNTYLYTDAEVHQRRQIKKLFTKFDTDGSGGLDA
jgi:hypothetical protein